MAFVVLVWALCFLAHAGLLAAAMYGLVVLADLESDYTNPHDCAASLNKWLLPEYATQSATAALFLLTGAWVPALAHGALSFKLWRGYKQGDAAVDVTEVFKQAPAEKRRRAWRLAGYLVSFVYVIYRLVEAAVSSLLTPEGRAAAHKLLVEAAAAPHV